MQKAMKFSDVAIVSIKRSDYRIHFWYMNKDDATNIMKNSDLIKKSGLLETFLLYMKMDDKTTYYQRNRENILN